MAAKRTTTSKRASLFKKQTILLRELVKGNTLEQAISNAELKREIVARWMTSQQFLKRLKKAISRVRRMKKIDKEFAIKRPREKSTSRSSSSPPKKKPSTPPCRMHESVTPERAGELRELRKNAVV